MEIKKITIDRLRLAFDDPLSPLNCGLYITQDEDDFIAIDNTTGDMWCEEFNDEETAKKWLEREE